MFRPNLICFIQQMQSYDDYGQPVIGRKKKERCAITRKVLTNRKTSVRADSSASRGSAREIEADVLVLVAPNTTADIDSIVTIEDERFRVLSKHARYAINGRKDHYELGCSYWSEADQ